VKSLFLDGVEVEEESFAEMFPTWVGQIFVTAISEKWALSAAQDATAFATTTIQCPVEAGIERKVPKTDTPDNRPGYIAQFHHRDRRQLKEQMFLRIRHIMMCPTTAVFDAMSEAERKMKVGRRLRLFGDGFQKKDEMFGRTVWRIPVTEGEFIVEEKFGTARGIAGGMFLIFALNQKSGLQAAEKAAYAISKVNGVITPFPGGICRSGSKVRSKRYDYKFLIATTNDLYCPTIRNLPESFVPDDVETVYEIIIDAISFEAMKKAMSAGIKAATKIQGIGKIMAANYGGTLGPFKLYLKDVL
jgi:formylmethanofuran--tetrahydromethanopterin N-formyltransferase